MQSSNSLASNKVEKNISWICYHEILYELDCPAVYFSYFLLVILPKSTALYLSGVGRIKNMLQTNRLGRTNYEVTRLGLGCYRFTGDFKISRSNALSLLNCALSLGFNYMDTAPQYGSGESEELIGRALRQNIHKSVFISTKVGHLDRTVVRSFGSEAYQSEECIRRVIEHSLWLLQKDQLEMVFVHEPEKEIWGWDEKKLDAPIIRILEKLKKERIIGAIGLGSNAINFPSRLAETGRFDVVEIANGYTLLSQKIKDRILPAVNQHDLGIIAGGPFRDGFLATRQYQKIEKMKQEKSFSGWANENSLDRLWQLYQLSEELEMPMYELSLRYILSEPAIHSVIPGAQRKSEVEANYRAAVKGPLSSDILATIQQIQEHTA